MTPGDRTHDDLDAHLIALARRTDGVVATPDFRARAFAAIARSKPHWYDEVIRPARWLVPLAAAAAILALFSAIDAERAYDDAVARRAEQIDAEWGR